MNPILKREWGAVAFIATVIVGALAVGIVFLIGAGHHTTVIAEVPCPTPTVSALLHAPSPGASVAASPTPPAVASGASSPSPTAFDVSLLNCPTATPTAGPPTVPAAATAPVVAPPLLSAPAITVTTPSAVPVPG